MGNIKATDRTMLEQKEQHDRHNQQENNNTKQEIQPFELSGDIWTLTMQNKRRNTQRQ